MAEVAFPLGLEGGFEVPQSRKALANCWNSGGPITQRPGITELSTTGRVARGHPFEWNGAFYGVCSQDLLKFDVSDGSFTIIGGAGAIAGTDEVVVAIGFNEAVIVVKGGNGYTLDATDTLTQITDPQYLPSRSVCHMKGRFIYIPSDGSPAFFSEVGDGGNILAASFFDAEKLPDDNEVCINFRDVLHIGGSDSFQPFRDVAGGTTIPYRDQNARVDNGYIGGILEYNNTFLYVGREKGQDFGIYAHGQGVSPKISNEYIDSILATYTDAELRECVSNRFKWLGFDIATFTLERHSFGFLGGNWFELSTLVNGDNLPWQGGYIAEFKQKYYVLFEGKFGRLDSINKDWGLPFERRIDLGFESEMDFSIQSVDFRLSQGYNANVGSVAIEMSDDNVLYGDPYHVNTGEVGAYSNRVKFNPPGGLGYYEGFAGIRISSAEDINFSASKLMVTTR